MYTKAEDVEQAYDAANWDNIHSEGCYALAVAAAHELGGIEVYNSNDGNSTISFAPTRTFEFDDSSSVTVAYGGVFVNSAKSTILKSTNRLTSDLNMCTMKLFFNNPVKTNQTIRMPR